MVEVVGPRLGELSPLAQAEAGPAWSGHGSLVEMYTVYHWIIEITLGEDLKYPETSSFGLVPAFAKRSDCLCKTLQTAIHPFYTQ